MGKMDRVLKAKFVGGNSCIYVVFMLFNFLLFLTAIGILGCAIYLFVLTKSGNVFNISFLIVSLVLFLFSLIGFFKLRKSVHLLGFYLFILFIVFLFQLILTIVIFVNKDKVVSWAKDHISGDSS